MGIYDVPAAMLIDSVAQDLKTRVKAPAFTKFAKTGSHRERSPINPDWFHLRVASILYRVYKDGPLGTGELRVYYGGRKNRGVRPEHTVRAGGKAIRLGLQILEKEGYIKKDKKGRIITGKGEKYLFGKSTEVGKVFTEKNTKEKQAFEDEAVKREQARQKRQQAAVEAAAAPQAAPTKGRHEQKPKPAQGAPGAAAPQAPGVTQAAPSAPSAPSAPQQKKETKDDRAGNEGKKA